MGKLNINRGTLYSITFNYKKNGVAESLVGSTVRFTIKDTEYDSDASDTSAEVVKNVTDGTVAGTCTITIDPSDTATLTPGKYFYDIKVDEDSDGANVYKVDSGTVKISGTPTNRLS